MILINLKENIRDKAFKRFINKHYHDILTEMLIDHQIETTQKNGQKFYVFPSA